jgi:maltoporin
MTHPRNNRLLALALAATAFAPAASMAQTLESSGYFRAGPGATKKDAARACYGLDGPGLKYRLGNECDYYGEFLFSSKFKKSDLEYSINLMPTLYNGGTDTGSSKMTMAQMFVEGKGFDFSPTTTFWAGKRYYRRADVHIVDTHYIDMSGVGAGASDISLGSSSAKMALGYFRNDGGDTGTSKLPGTRLNFDFYDIAVNSNGKLRLLGTFTKGDFTGGQSGAGLTAQHVQGGLPGGLENTFWLQYAQGSAGLNANFGNLSAPAGTKSVRVIDSITWQSGALGGQAQVAFQNDRSDAGVKTDSVTVGGRASYALTRNFKLLAELGHSEKKPDGGQTQKLTKFTFAPTLSTGPDFWNRPELRLYVTTARWNDAANTAAGAGGVTGIADGKTKGTSFGAQVEVWW